MFYCGSKRIGGHNEDYRSLTLYRLDRIEAIIRIIALSPLYRLDRIEVMIRIIARSPYTDYGSDMWQHTARG